MAKLLGCMVMGEYSPGKRTNSFYKEREPSKQMDFSYLKGTSETVYYVDRKSSRLKAKETSLLQ